MKTLRIHLLTLAIALGALRVATAQQVAPPTDPPPVQEEPIPADTNEPVDDQAEAEREAPVVQAPDPVVEPSDLPSAPPDSPRTRSRRDSRGPTATPNNLPAPPSSPVGEGEKELRLNFRGVPLEMVLNYLSDAAGFIINLETEVRGRVDLWSNQPLTKQEAVELLNTVLNKNGYAAIRKDRTLTIVSRDDAKKRNIPVVSGNRPEDIPQSDEVVTQIIPVRYISAVQLVKDLDPLLPDKAELSANEGGNALVLTDTQSSIRRMVEIVEALDQAIASVSSVRVFALQYADAKAVATVITQLFQTQDTSRGNNRGGSGRVFAAFARGDQGGENSGGNTASTSGGRAPTPRVVAVADERSNSVVVSAPAEQLVIIEGIVQDVDTNVEDITELRVFSLKHADPQETAEMLTNLFEDMDTAQNNRQRSQFRRNNNNRGGNAANAQSERLLKQSRVVAVPDLRTGSVVVSASRELMTQIGIMLEQLDADPARKQKVFVYSVENTDPQAVQEVLQTLFPEQSLNQNRNLRNNQGQNENQLNNRQTQTRNQGARNSGANGLGNLGGNNLGGQ